MRQKTRRTFCWGRNQRIVYIKGIKTSFFLEYSKVARVTEATRISLKIHTIITTLIVLKNVESFQRSNLCKQLRMKKA